MLRRRRSEVEEAKADMTPCIDIVFNLLIFFLCATKIRATEGAITAFLPKDQGPNASQAALPTNDVRVKLLWLDDAGRPASADDGGHVVVSIGARRLNAPGELDRAVAGHAVWRELHAQLVALKEASAGPMPVIIDARPQVPTQHVISALNEVVRAGLADVRFAAPGRD
jgi:biopolymer transport protein ExbD